MTSPLKPVIQLQHITKSFILGDQTIHALDDINLDIYAGEYISIMGPSGSGKSTLLQHLGLLDKPDSGCYKLDGINTNELNEEARAKLRREKIGFVFQAFHLIPRLTARENIELPMMLEGIPANERKARAFEVMQRLNLRDRADHTPNQLSGGQQQRVAIARAIVMRPSLLLTDEPTGNLDSKSGKEVIELLEELHDSGMTLLIVTHDQSLGNRAHRKLGLIDGKVVIDEARHFASS